MRVRQETTYDRLSSLLPQIARTVFRRFPKLADLVLQKSQEICFSEKTRSLEIVENLVKSEIVYRFTNDDEYLVEHAQMGSMYTDR